MNQSFSLEDFLASASEPKRKDSLNLCGANTSTCITKYLLSNNNLTESRRKEVARYARYLDDINRNLPTYKFDFDFNSNLAVYLLQVHGMKPLSVEIAMRAIVSALRWAGRHGAELSETYDHIPKIPYDPHRISLSLQEVAAIYDYDVSSLPYRSDKLRLLDACRDMFVMNCIGYGLRYSDLTRLNDSYFRDGELSLVMQKTGRRVTNKLDMVLYQRMYDDLQRKYPSHEPPYTGWIGRYNEHLKTICRHIGGTFNDIEVIEYKVGEQIIHEEKPRWKLISSHVARRTYITNNILVFGHSVTEVQHAVGHSQSSTTDKYIVM